MKIIIASLLCLSFASAVEVRQTASSFVEADKKDQPPLDPTQYIGMTFSASHVQDFGNGVDNNAILQIFHDAYAATHNNGFEITSLIMDHHLEIEEDDDAKRRQLADKKRGRFNPYLYTKYWYWGGWDCRACPNDDDYLLPPLVLAATSSNKSQHAAFEDAVCQGLRDSGMPEYADVDECQIDFTYAASQYAATASTSFALDQMEETLYKGSKGTMRGELDMSRYQLDDSIPLDDIWAAIAKAFTDAYNEIHPDYHASDFHIQREIDIPEDDDDDDETDDEDRKLGKRSRFNPYRYTKYWYWFGYDCRACPPDDDNFAVTSRKLRSRRTDNKHRAFESLVCNKLHKTNLPVFDKIEDCRVSFTYSH